MFESWGLVKPLAWIIGFQAALYLLVLRPWRLRDLPRAVSPGIDVFACLLIGLGFLALAEGRPFDATARVLIERTSLPDSIATLDRQFADLEQLPDRLWDDLKSTFGFEEPAPRVPPARIERPGAIESAVIEAVEEVVSVVMRAYVYITCVVTLWMSILLRLFIRSTTARQLRDERLLEATADVVTDQIRARTP